MSATPPAEGEAKVDWALSWIAFGCAVIGGWAAIAIWIGDWVAGFVGLFPDAVAPVLFVVGVAVVAIDLFRDGTPNRPAIYFAILLPSVGLGVNGKLAAQLNTWGDQVNRATSEKVGEWLGQGGLNAIALVAIALAVIVAQKAIKKTPINPFAARSSVRSVR